jgi:hypothetical protein
MDSESKAWSDPPVFDAPLTQRGHSQAAALRDPLQKMVAKRLVGGPAGEGGRGPAAASTSRLPPAAVLWVPTAPV